MVAENQTTEEVQTTDATQTTAWTGTPGDGEACRAEVKIIAKKSGGSQAGEYHFKGLFRRSGGTTTQVGSTTDVSAAIEDDAAWAAVFDTSGADFRVRITGVAATTINWLVEVKTKSL